MTLLETQGLTKHYAAGRGFGRAHVVRALSDVSLTLDARETLAVVGESGCGKSTLARCVTGLVEATSGALLIAGEPARDLLRRDPMGFRRSIQMVFQDPYSSVNPRRRVADTVADGLRLHKIVPRARRRDRVLELLGQVGLSAEHLGRYPHELSGGQRQRVAIARALAVNPSIIVCDEPVSALDVSVQAQVMNLLADVQRERGVAYLFISHDLALVQHIAHRIAVMYLGQIVETGTTAAFRRHLAHPYSRSLFAAAPRIGKPREKPVSLLEGDVPSPLDPPSGCPFHTRCPHAEPRCMAEMPDLRPVHDRLVRCHRAEELWDNGVPSAASGPVPVFAP
jgi:oligopeptide/dipeptide ABC transporter ATP-binding protein